MSTLRTLTALAAALSLTPALAGCMVGPDYKKPPPASEPTPEFKETSDSVFRPALPGEALDAMHKVVLEVKGEPQLRALAAALAEAGVGHRLWIEQPEGVATCLATQPDAKETLAPHFKKLQLCK